MTKHILPLAGLLVSAPLALAACDAQTGPGYAGEALLTLTGSVSGAELEGVVPALAFGDVFTDDAYLMDVDVTGEFPANFSVRVFDAPPKALLDKVLTLPGEPRGSLAQIVALDADHPDTLEKWDPIVHKESACETETTCTRDLTVYDEDGEEVLFTQHSECDAEWKNCKVTSSGDPDAQKNPARWFHGVVASYGVVYFQDPVPARSIAGSVYLELEAGYHLLKFAKLSESEKAEMESCRTEADKQGMATYNQKNGTNYASIDDIADGAEQFAAISDLKDAFFDLGCRLDTGEKVTVLEAAGEHPLKLELVEDASGLDLPVLF